MRALGFLAGAAIFALIAWIVFAIYKSFKDGTGKIGSFFADLFGTPKAKNPVGVKLYEATTDERTANGLAVNETINADGNIVTRPRTPAEKASQMFSPMDWDAFDADLGAQIRAERARAMETVGVGGAVFGRYPIMR